MGGQSSNESPIIHTTLLLLAVVVVVAVDVMMVSACMYARKSVNFQQGKVGIDTCCCCCCCCRGRFAGSLLKYVVVPP